MTFWEKVIKSSINSNCKNIDSTFELDIDLTIFLMMLPFDLDI